jgi:hypothetical protein
MRGLADASTFDRRVCQEMEIWIKTAESGLCAHSQAQERQISVDKQSVF